MGATVWDGVDGQRQGSPEIALLLGQSAPRLGDACKIAAQDQLNGGLGVHRDDVSAFDLAIAPALNDVLADFAYLGNVENLHK